MSIRLNAEWMEQPDERILETLKGEGWMHPRMIASAPSVYLSYRQVCERLRMLADGDLVALSDDDFDLYHLTAEGEWYLDGRRDQGLHLHPFYYGLATASLIR